MLETAKVKVRSQAQSCTRKYLWRLKSPFPIHSKTIGKLQTLYHPHFFNIHSIFCIFIIQYIKMASGGSMTCWEAPQFLFNTPDQTHEWKNFYTRVLNFLETLSAATTTASSVHQDNVTLHNTQCTRCGYKHPCDNCPAKGKKCYNFHGLNHYTALCRCPKQRKTNPFRATSRPL